MFRDRSKLVNPIGSIVLVVSLVAPSGTRDRTRDILYDREMLWLEYPHKDGSQPSDCVLCNRFFRFRLGRVTHL